MNRNLRLKIEESIDTKTLSENLLLLCLACLHEKINYTNKASVLNLEKQRIEIAKAALHNGLDKQTITEKIKLINSNDYPTFKQISRVITVIEGNHYSFISDFIPDRMIHYKSDEQLQADLQRTPKPKKEKTIDYSFESLCFFIKKEIMCYSDFDLSNQQIRYLQGLKTDSYNYDVILQCFTEYKNDIEKALWQNTFKSEYEKLCYACGVMKNHLIDILKRIDYKKKQKELIDYAMKTNTYNPNYQNHFQSQQEEINPILAKEFKDLW